MHWYFYFEQHDKFTKRPDLTSANLIWNADTCPVSRRGVCELSGMYASHRISAETVKSNNECQLGRFVIM